LAIFFGPTLGPASIAYSLGADFSHGIPVSLAEIYHITGNRTSRFECGWARSDDKIDITSIDLSFRKGTAPQPGIHGSDQRLAEPLQYVRHLKRISVRPIDGSITGVVDRGRFFFVFGPACCELTYPPAP